MSFALNPFSRFFVIICCKLFSILVTTTQFRVQAKQMWCIFSHNLVAVFLFKLPWPTQCSSRPSRYCVKKVHQIKHIPHTKRFCAEDSFWLSLLSRLELLSLAECPVSQLPATEALPKLPPGLHSLNISTTKIKDWAEVDKLRKFPALEDLRISHCPFLDELSAHEKRTMLIARLPNVQVSRLHRLIILQDYWMRGV